MIKADFKSDEGRFFAVEVSGHAGYAAHGQDIVCASVTSAVMLTANGITEVLKIPAKVTLSESEIALALPYPLNSAAAAFFQALYLHLSLLQQQYPDHMKIIVLEV